jgi:hypothetical protein
MTEQCSLHEPGEVITAWPSSWRCTRAALLTPQPTPFTLKAPGMAAFSVFFCDQERCSIQPVRAMDPDHAIAQVRSSHPDLRRVAVVPDELLKGVDPLQLLEEWIQAMG